LATATTPPPLALHLAEPHQSRNLLIQLLLRRSPDEAKVKTKMLYASSKDAIRRSLVGIANEIQATDFSEVAYTESEQPPAVGDGCD